MTTPTSPYTQDIALRRLQDALQQRRHVRSEPLFKSALADALNVALNPPNERMVSEIETVLCNHPHIAARLFDVLGSFVGQISVPSRLMLALEVNRSRHVQAVRHAARLIFTFNTNAGQLTQNDDQTARLRKSLVRNVIDHPGDHDAIVDALRAGKDELKPFSRDLGAEFLAAIDRSGITPYLAHPAANCDIYRGLTAIATPNIDLDGPDFS